MLKNTNKQHSKNRYLAILLLLAIISPAVLITSCAQIKEIIAPNTSTPTITPEALLPTRTPSALDNDTLASSTPDNPVSETTSTSTPGVTPTPTPESMADDEGEGAGTAEDLERFGVTGDFASAQIALDEGMVFSHLLIWHVAINPPTDDYTFWQMIRVGEDGIRETSWSEIEQAIAANPGSFWIVGNEPDVIWQDDVTPERYAEIYHDVYSFIKERDPQAQIVIGGVSQPTPLRRAYLDKVLDTYQEKYGEQMPIDVWNVHAFVLREEADSWGVDIPPGMDVREGMLYEIEDHSNVDILRQNLLDFRAWMADRGYQDKPLVISEFGILMPEDYGFPIEVMGKFMRDTFDLFLTEANETGYPADDNHLVQWWFWYILWEVDYYPYGKLVEVPDQTLTPLGEVWRSYIQDLSQR